MWFSRRGQKVNTVSRIHFFWNGCDSATNCCFLMAGWFTHGRLKRTTQHMADAYNNGSASLLVACLFVWLFVCLFQLFVPTETKNRVELLEFQFVVRCRKLALRHPATWWGKFSLICYLPGAWHGGPTLISKLLYCCSQVNHLNVRVLHCGSGIYNVLYW